MLDITKHERHQESGFTLVEMMIVLAILAALLLVAAPGLNNLILNNQMVTDVYALRATLNNARSEAVTRRAPVVVCPSANGTSCTATTNWSDGYMTFVDTNEDIAPDPNDPDEEIVQWEPRGRAMGITYNNGGGNQQVVFNPHGAAIGFEGSFVFCDERKAGDARALILNAVGSVRSATDTTSSGVVDVGGTDVSCP